MTVLRFRTTEQSIHDRPQAQQILNPGDQFGVAALLAGDVAGRRIRPLDGNKTSAAVRTKKEKLDFLLLTDLLQNFNELALEYMRLAHDPDRGRKFVEMGSVSGSPSRAGRSTAEHPRARPGIAVARVGRLAEKLRIASRVALSEGDREIRLEKREQEVAEIARLDDCHALKTDLGREVADKDLVHRRYKDLALVETAFRDRGMPRPFPNHA